MAKQDCGNCRFYLDRDWQGDGRHGYGKCRRYPDAVDVNDGHWCGEFVEKVKAHD